jgi:hypothetical protein
MLSERVEEDESLLRSVARGLEFADCYVLNEISAE